MLIYESWSHLCPNLSGHFLLKGSDFLAFFDWDEMLTAILVLFLDDVITQHCKRFGHLSFVGDLIGLL